MARKHSTNDTQRTFTDLIYAEVGERSLLLDLQLPSLGEPPYPLLVYIFGGGWFWHRWRTRPVVRIIDDHLLSRGYAVASIDHRVSTEAPFPAHIEDCKAAIRWLRAHAGEYQLDGSRIGAYGFSSGAHLVALLGLTGSSGLFSGVGGHQDTDDSITAACVFAVTSNFFLPPGPSPESPIPPRQIHAHLFGGPIEEKRELVTQANPLTHVHPDAPPFLILHNRHDSVVPVQQGEILHEALQRAGVESTLYIIPEDDHGLSGASEEERAHLIQLATTFFERWL